MIRAFAVACVAVALAMGVSSSLQAEIEGDYIEARTCDVYTGPCFANGEVGLTGKDAVMAWNVFKGEFAGVDLKGLSVVMLVKGSETLGHKGLNDPAELKSLVIVDDEATPQQREALIAFAKAQTGKAGECIGSVKTAPIDMKLDTFELCGSLKAGDFAELDVRKAGEDDCICSNERGFYPPLASLEHAVPGVVNDGEITARELNTRWSIPGARSVYLGTFRQ